MIVILLGESIHDGADVRAAVEAALVQVKWRWSDVDDDDDEDPRILTGFLARSAQVDEFRRSGPRPTLREPNDLPGRVATHVRGAADGGPALRLVRCTMWDVLASRHVRSTPAPRPLLGALGDGSSAVGRFDPDPEESCNRWTIVSVTFAVVCLVDRAPIRPRRVVAPALFNLTPEAAPDRSRPERLPSASGQPRAVRFTEPSSLRDRPLAAGRSLALRDRARRPT